MYKAKVTSKGQLTIPIAIRRKMGIKSGSYLILNETPTGYLIQKPVDEDCLNKYIGILNQDKDSDRVLEELRGE
jgi:AbrB family looped-hinge helix DNA binding protein